MDGGDIICNIMITGSRGAINNQIWNIHAAQQENVTDGVTRVTEIVTDELSKDATKGGFADFQVDHWARVPGVAKALADAAYSDLEFTSTRYVGSKGIRSCRRTGYQSFWEEDKEVYLIRQFFQAYVLN